MLNSQHETSLWSRCIQNRRYLETIGLAIISILAIGSLRFPIEARSWIIAEMCLIVCMLATRIVVPSLAFVGTAMLVSVPVIVAGLARLWKLPIAFEMTALTTFGTLALGLAVETGVRRHQATSIVTSGFLVLFTTSISDSPRAVTVAVFWITVCVWHLVANHWDQLDLCLPENVRPSVGVRPASVIVAVALCSAGGWLVRDRFTDSHRLNWGIMPTSGGSRWSDPAARSGVGDGEATIAAKDHAESFGAVETDLFLESTESSLFDMFSDTLGPPKKKSTWERRQAMSSDMVLEAHERQAKTEKGGSSFTTDRESPEKKHRHLGDAEEPAVVQWAGPTGIRLAMNRYDAFDGLDWHSTTALHNDQLVRHAIDQAVWFFDPRLMNLALQDSRLLLGQLKVLRLNSTRVPAPMMTAGVHIKDVDRQDFFGLENDGSLSLPGREKIPALTVLNLASTSVREDELMELTMASEIQPLIEQDGLDSSIHETLRTLARQWTIGCSTPYEKLARLVEHLRHDFTFDRYAATSSEHPLADFLQTRQGGDHLFATTAALMAQEIGLQARLVTGFYVRPSMFDIVAGHAAVQAEDVHVWVEVRLDDARWFEIEPTPGYQPPIYTPSRWLTAKRFCADHWRQAVSVGLLIATAMVTRLIWMEWLLTALWWLSTGLAPSRRLPIIMWIIQTRARLIGQPRPIGKPQRDWLLSLAGNHERSTAVIRRFCDAVDQLAFQTARPSGCAHLDGSSFRGLERSFTIKQLRQHFRGD